MLTACWEATRSEVVPPFRDGYTDVRRCWDAAVSDALGWDMGEIVQGDGERGAGAGDAAYAYDLTGERDEAREFATARANRAARGI